MTFVLHNWPMGQSDIAGVSFVVGYVTKNVLWVSVIIV